MGQGTLFGDAPPRRRETVTPVEVPAAVARTAERLPGGLRLGTSSWSFPGWQGIVYDGKHPKATLSRRGLTAYSRHPLLRAAGIDRTYYGPIPAEAFSGYARQVPADFRFTVKAHEYCTLPRFPAMDRYGDRAGSDNGFFLHSGYARDEVIGPCVEGLKDKLGVLLFQFSPMDPEEVGGPDEFSARLHRFLDELPKGPTYAVELRSAKLFGEAYLSALADSGAIHCHNVHPSMPPIGSQARAAAERGKTVFVRWMLHSGFSYAAALERYAPFDRLVDEDAGAREESAGLCRRAAAAQRDAFVIANNKAEGSAPLTVFRLAERLAELASEARP
jgi:uncharacterized protein YecE (DUF72 family)